METKRLPAERDRVAPDGCDVRLLLEVGGGGMAHFELGPGETSIAIKHRTVEEVWYFLNGRGEMWRADEDGEQVTDDVGSGVCISIQSGITFQFRCFWYEPLSAIGATMPRWPGVDETIQTEGCWPATVASGPA
jgi:mannose-6-phosphate isomerase-like protein (cupin superfamily)